MTAKDDRQVSPARTKRVISLSVMLAAAIAILAMFADGIYAQKERKPSDQINNNAQQMVDEGRQIFRFDTFGDEAFWGDSLKLHQAIQGSMFGGVGPGVSPKTAGRIPEVTLIRSQRESKCGAGDSLPAPRILERV